MTKNKRLFIFALLVTCLALTLVLASCIVTPGIVVSYDSTHMAHVGDSLDSLRPYLTVRYANPLGAMTIVEDYTLSGELSEEGVCTVYVHYQDATKPISVTVLPKQVDGGDGGDGEENVAIQISATTSSVVAGESTTISVSTTPEGHEREVQLEVIQGAEYGYVEGNVFYAVAAGECTVVGKIDDNVSNQLVINVTKGSSLDVAITLSVNKTFIEKNNYTDMTVTVNPSSYESQVQYRFIEGGDCVTRIGVSLRGDSSGVVKVQAYIEDCVSNVASFQIVDPDEDPYKNVSTTSFYNNYNVATSLEDSYWRTQHNLMSGDINVPNQAPTVASSQPKSGNKLVRNSDTNYIDNGNTWEVVDSSGNVVNKIYKFGAYITLEEVAAYVYAFGDIPANYITSNDTGSLSGNAWGKYLRLNHNSYSNNTTNYPYEPKLPETGPSGKLKYYEIDIGTTGTNAGGYTPVLYNTGSQITRGAARIVYTRYYANSSHIDELEYRYVFYTYNHYNDFQEYLNYQNGWGTMFGNISNGGTYNKGSNPSPYVDVVRQNFKLLSDLVG